MSRTILITGTSSGFGKLAAITLAGGGHSVIAGMRNTTTVNAEAAKELSTYDNIEVVEMDVASDESVQAAVDIVLKKYGQIDVLVNNAGVVGFGVFESSSVDQMKRLFDVNLWGVARGILAVLPSMRKQRSGLIINVTSGLGLFSTPFTVPYNMSKFAIEGMTEGIRQEVKPFDIELVTVLPGPFPTGIASKTGYSPDREAILEEYGSETKEAIGRFGGNMFAKIEETQADPQEVADAIYNLVELKAGMRPIQTAVNRMGKGADQRFAESKLPYAKELMENMGWKEFI